MAVDATGELGGLAMVSAGLSNSQSLADVRKIIIDTVEGLPKEPPTKDEVDRVKQRLLRSTENAMTNSQQLGLSLSEWTARGDWRLLFLNRDRVASVTPDDVVRVAKAYLKESNRTVGEFIPTSPSWVPIDRPTTLLNRYCQPDHPALLPRNLLHRFPARGSSPCRYSRRRARPR